MSRLFVFVLGLLLCGVALADAPFTLSGRIAIRQGEQAYNGALHWRHTADTDELTLAGPLGQGVAELRRDGEHAVLQLPNGERHEAATLEALADRLFGTPLPITALPDWIRGVAPDAQLDELKRPLRLVLPDFWMIQWLRYDDAGRPQLLSLENQDVGVRLRIDSWADSADDDPATANAGGDAQ
ncbi:MAG TPA: lipoprotein insertase outer membrane protein LolB [Rhodocyclaceae bacterium]|nr:lipoprotein insertase outer membrane protein LolB [Rhodocyclaceae bacterium]